MDVYIYKYYIHTQVQDIDVHLFVQSEFEHEED